MERIKLIRDSFQNWKGYNIPKANLVICDPPYRLGNKAYASNPQWYNNGSISEGESELAKQQFFYNDNEWRETEFWHFCSKMLIREPKQKGKAGCMIIFCAFEQQMHYIELGKRMDSITT